MPGRDGSSDSAGRAADSAAALGRGELPVEAVARLDQLRRTSSWTSDLGVGEFAAVRGVGFDPVGQVMGSTVDQIGYSGWGACGTMQYAAARRYGYPTRTTTGSAGSRWVGYGILRAALYAARRRAVARLAQECTAVCGDGVVGVRLSIRPFPGVAHALEFTVMGTAVRARGRHHLTAPFLCDLSGQDFARLLRSGWVPCGIAFGVAVGVRHDDYRTVGMAGSWRNGEVPGYTDLVQRTRAEVRDQIGADVTRQGGSALAVRDMTLKIREQECRIYEGNRDHVAEATMIGTALTPLRPGQQPDRQPDRGVLQILRLDQPHDRVVGARLTDQGLEQQ